LPPNYLTEQFPSQVFSEPATNPPLPNLVITSSQFPWKIVVNPSHDHSDVVTVSDVFTALYHGLRPSVHPAEYETTLDRDLVDAAYYARCGRVMDADARLLERRKGVKRVDTLKGRTQFLGLAGTVKSPNHWELYLA